MKKVKLSTEKGFAIGVIISEEISNCIYGGRKIVFHKTEKTGHPNEFVKTRIEVTEFGQYGSLKFSDVEFLEVNTDVTSLQ